MTRILLVVAAAVMFILWLVMRREVRRVGERLRRSEAERARMQRRRDPQAGATETLERDPRTGTYRPRRHTDKTDT